jgi:hypothetical protein
MKYLVSVADENGIVIGGSWIAGETNLGKPGRDSSGRGHSC